MDGRIAAVRSREQHLGRRSRSISPVPSSTSQKTGVGARVDDAERGGDEGVRRDDDLVAALIPAASRASVSAAVPEPTPTQCRTPQ